jgi:ribulose 1,5-bisphosphate synthetase/thiazole synthase
MAGSSTCKLCGRPIVWAKTARGANVCLDPNPSARGEYILEATGTENGRVLFAVRRQRPDDAPGRRYTSHFDSCPQWRRQARP